MENQFTEEIADRFIKALIEVLEIKYDVEIKYTLKEKEAK